MTRMLSLGALLLLAGCAVFEGTQPPGFAPWHNNSGRNFRAASPDGMIWRIRTEPHRPQANLDFWKRALRDRLVGAGYHLVDSLSFKMGETPAFAFEAGLNGDAWLVAVAPLPDQIIVVEASGSLENFQKHRADLLATLPKIRPR